jgi:phage tail-like protein
MPATAASTKGIISAARFIMSSATGNGKWPFSEMTNISMEVEPHEFIYCDPTGGISHNKFYGKTNPPKVTLKKPMDTDTTLWGWHLAVQEGSPSARVDCSLIAYGPGTAPPKPGDKVFEWLLALAWPSKIELSGLKAGATDTAVLTVTFACDMITIPGQNGSATGGIPS